MAEIRLLNDLLKKTGDTMTGDLGMASGVNVIFPVSGSNDIGTSNEPLGTIYVDEIYVGGSLINISGSSSSMVNLGSGIGVFAQKIGNQFELKSLVDGSGISITSDTDNIYFNVTSVGASGDFVATSGGTMTGPLYAPFVSGTIISGNQIFSTEISGQTIYFNILSGNSNNNSFIWNDPSFGLNITSDEIYIHNTNETGYLLIQSGLTYIDSGGYTIIQGSGIDAFVVDASSITTYHTISPVLSGSANLGNSLNPFGILFSDNIASTTSIQLNGNDVIISGANLGTGESLFSSKNGTDLEFKTISGVGSISVTSNANVVTISGTDTGEINTASNLGSGYGWFESKSGSDLRFNSITSGTNVTITSGVGNLQVGISNNPIFQNIFANIVSGTTISGNTLFVGNLNGILRANSGLVSGSSTTTDLPEGINLYYTEARVSANTSVSGNTLNVATVSGITAQNSLDIANVSGVAFSAIQSGVSLGFGQSVFVDKNGTNLQFKTVSGLGALSITNDANTVYFSGTGTGESNTASNLGSGVGLFSAKVGSDLRFYSISGVGNVVATLESNTVNISGNTTLINVSVLSGTTISGNTATITTINNTTLNGSLGIFTTVSGLSNIYGTSTLQNVQFNSTSGVYVRSNTGNNGLVLESSVKPVKILSPSGTILQWSEQITYPNFAIIQASGATTDSTDTVLQSISTDTNSVYLIESRVIGRRTGGSSGAVNDSAAYIRTARIKNDAGTVTANNVQSDYTSEDQGPWNSTINVSGTDARIIVRGANNNNVSWNTTTKIQKL